jgi:uncharacterized membrane protein
MRRLRPRATPTGASHLLSAVLVVTGSLHFLSPGSYDGLIPPALPGPSRWWTWGSGVAELACAAALAHPATRRRAAYATALLFVGVFPGNLWMAWEWRDRDTAQQLIAYGRLPLQVPLVWWALYAARDSAA